MEKEICFKIGYIAKPHGLKGEITVIITDPVNLGSIETIFVEFKGTLVPYFMKTVSDRGDKAFLKLEEINTLEQALALKGNSIYLPKEVRPKLSRGEFYDDEIIGYTVEDELLGILGEVKEISANGPNRLISLNHKSKEVLIPTNGPFIKSVNKSKKMIRVNLPEGFLDI